MRLFSGVQTDVYVRRERHNEPKKVPQQQPWDEILVLPPGQLAARGMRPSTDDHMNTYEISVRTTRSHQ